ncbi:MAG: hypothetical protein ACXVJD_13150 [Mucilaginibacter sp.]
MHKVIKTLGLLFSICYFKSYAQTGGNTILALTEKLNTFTFTHNIEKAYLHFDKPYYAIGDTIYFKAYVTLGGQHKLSALSGILYADLIGPDNKISRSIKLPVIAGTAWGDFTLADTLKGGDYRIRAYTNWMRNEGGDSFFERTIPVGITTAGKIAESSGFGKTSSNEKIISNKPDVQFLPEGGSLVAGNYSKVAFKAVASNGHGTNVKGIVTDDTGTEICTFASTHLGMGAFYLVPEAGKTYKAHITYADGSTGNVELPKAVNAGYTINVNNNHPDTIKLRITACNGCVMNNLNLIAQSGGIVYYAAENQSDNKFFTAVIPKTKFPTGIVQFTLFSPAGEPLNERLAFINNGDEVKLDVAAKQTYAPRQKVTIQLDAHNKYKKPVTGSFSVAVTDETIVPADTANENNILSNLLLTSELKGTIEQPNYYFTDNSKKTQTDLDNLMLTQGYRSFSWKKVINEKPQAPAYQPETGLAIEGQVTRSGKPLAGSKVTLFSKTDGPFILDTLTDAAGNFSFKNLDYNDSTRFVLQAKANKGQDNVAIKLKGLSPPPVLAQNSLIDSYESSVATSDGFKSYLVNQKEFYREQARLGINQQPAMLKEVVIRDKKSFLKHSDNLNGPGSADMVVTADEIKELVGVTLSFRLKTKLTGLVDFKRGIPYAVGSHVIVGPMQIIIDGNFVDYDAYEHIDPDRVQSVEVLASPNYGTVYGPKGGTGILLITTKRGEDYKNERIGVNKPPLLLKEVKVKGKKESAIPDSQNLNGAGHADQALSAKDLEKFTCGRIADCLSGVLSGVIFRNGVPMNVRKEMAKMAIIVDGNFVDADVLDNLHQEEIEGIEVILGEHYGSIYGSRMANGGIIVTTKRAKPNNNYYRYAPGITTFAGDGFYKAREFYSPQYENATTNQNVADLRSTIYWKPDIITDKDGKASFTYYNADGKGTYRIVIEGIDADGNLGRQVFRYQVQ